MPLNASFFLTQREKEVLEHLAQGKRPDQIAHQMSLSTATINLHIQKAKRRLNANTREQAVALAIARKEISLSLSDPITPTVPVA